MVRYTIRRFLRGLLTVWLVMTVVFVVLRISGDPAEAMLPDDATIEQIDAFHRQHGLDQPIPMQHYRYFANILQGNFGNLLSERRSVVELFEGIWVKRHDRPHRLTDHPCLYT